MGIDGKSIGSKGVTFHLNLSETTLTDPYNLVIDLKSTMAQAPNIIASLPLTLDTSKYLSACLMQNLYEGLKCLTRIICFINL
jgi:hypothetical protein